MDVFELPFNQFVGIEPSPDNEYLLFLNEKDIYHNHLKTVHASAQFALAEATSGFFLISQFRELTNIFPVVRKVEIKYKKPAQGCLYSKAGFIGTERERIIKELNERKRVLISVRVLLYDSGGNNVMQADFEWFLAMK
ncbi:MAG TPA: hypothetical protein DEO70_14705 [Bacteroidales bacterium]|nr:MAG: hypothetical protein A2X11_06490 [Bacteroidetes bacterium GWE2_42_24]OFY25661.1 MAG: hypothetical protein A2X09_01715 [Bacteroidetes bacterium GWF2_43_11]HBZ68081.1 hypothetical protein [Bacteroidales bacterium]